MDCGGHITDRRSSYGSPEVTLWFMEVKLQNTGDSAGTTTAIIETKDYNWQPQWKKWVIS